MPRSEVQRLVELFAQVMEKGVVYEIICGITIALGSLLYLNVWFPLFATYKEIFAIILPAVIIVLAVRGIYIDRRLERELILVDKVVKLEKLPANTLFYLFEQGMLFETIFAIIAVIMGLYYVDIWLTVQNIATIPGINWLVTWTCPGIACFLGIRSIVIDRKLESLYNAVRAQFGLL